MIRRRATPPLAALLGACLVAGGCAGRVEMGRAAYQQSCSGCHGAAGAGDGTLAPLVPGGVPDLTALSAGSGGSFPHAEVVRRIDNGRAVHGRLVAMPDFGGLLDGPRGVHVAPSGERIETAEAVLAIAAYLETLQAAPDG